MVSQGRQVISCTFIFLKSLFYLSAIPRHPMPFAAKNMFYDERWIEKQENAFTCWMNYMLTPDDFKVNTEVAKGERSLLSRMSLLPRCFGLIGRAVLGHTSLFFFSSSERCVHCDGCCGQVLRAQSSHQGGDVVQHLHGPAEAEPPPPLRLPAVCV